MNTAITRYVATGQPKPVQHAAWLLCRWLTDHPAGAGLTVIQDDAYFHDRRDHASGTPVTRQDLASAVQVLVAERRLTDVDGIYRLRPELLQPLDVTTAEWPGKVVPGFKRKRYEMCLSLCPSGWPLSTPQAGYPGHQLCGSVFERAHSPRGLCDDLPVWRINRFDGRMSGTQYWCDAELPSDLRPFADDLKARPGCPAPARQ